MTEIDDMEEDADIAGIMPILEPESPCSECGGYGWVYWSETGAEQDPSDPTGQTAMPVEIPMRAPCPNGCKPHIESDK